LGTDTGGTFSESFFQLLAMEQITNTKVQYFAQRGVCLYYRAADFGGNLLFLEK
jgi:hypothetical protein